MKKRTWRWVSRSEYSDMLLLHHSRFKPKVIIHGGTKYYTLRDSDSDSDSISFCCGEFFALTGISIARGECVKIDFSQIKVIE